MFQCRRLIELNKGKKIEHSCFDLAIGTTQWNFSLFIENKSIQRTFQYQFSACNIKFQDNKLSIDHKECSGTIDLRCEEYLRAIQILKPRLFSFENVSLCLCDCQVVLLQKVGFCSSSFSFSPSPLAYEMSSIFCS